MAFSVNTNLGALQAYNALAKVNAETQKAQLRIATMKKINNVADDTSGFNVGKQLEAQSLKQKAQLNNVNSAKNYLATSESALQQINDKLNQISSKYTDSQDPLKDKDSIANDISTLAAEITSILQTTNINDKLLLVKDAQNLKLAKLDEEFGLGGATFNVDFGGDMDTVALFAKIDALQIGINSGGVADANVHARISALAASASVQTKMTEANFSASNLAAYSTAFNAAYDAGIAASIGVNLALENALAAGSTAAGANGTIGGVGGKTVADALANGTSTTGTAAIDVTTGGTYGLALGAINGWTGADDITAKSYVMDTLIPAVLGKLTDAGFTVGQQQTYLDAFNTHWDANVAALTGAGGDDYQDLMVAALTDAAAAVTTGTSGHTAVEALAHGVITIGTAAVTVNTFQTAINVAYADGLDDVLPGDTDSVIAASQDVSAAVTGIRTALGRIGNLSQSIESRSEFLTTSIANNTALISSIFDTDMAAEQLNATKGQIASQITTAMLSQMNTSPQNLLSLFR